MGRERDLGDPAYRIKTDSFAVHLLISSVTGSLIRENFFL